MTGLGTPFAVVKFLAEAPTPQRRFVPKDL